MAAVNHFSHKLLRFILALISIRGLLVASIALLLLLGDVRPHVLSQFDFQFSQLVQRLSPPREVKSPVAIIIMEDDDIAQLQRDPISSSALPLLLQDKQIALVMPDAIREQPLYAEQLLAQLESSEHESIYQWQKRTQTLTQFNQRLETGKILVGLTQAGASSFPEQAYPIAQPNLLSGWINGLLPQGYAAPIMEWMNNHFALTAKSWEVDPALTGAAYRAMDSALPGQPHQLLWQQESQFHSDLALALFIRNLANNLGVKEEPQILFQNGFGVELAHRWLPIGSNSSIVPALLSDASVDTLTLTQALVSPPSQPIWIIAPTKQQGWAVASTFLALQSHQYFYAPFWANEVQATLLILFALYALFLQPMLRHSMAIMMLGFFVSAMIVVQSAWQLTFHQILPLPIVVQWLISASILMMVWKQRKNQLARLQWAHHNRSYELSQLCYQQGNLEQSLNTLHDCKTTENVLSLLYDIAVQHERKRNYEQAANTYDTLIQRRPRFKDATKRADALRKLSEPVQSASDFSATHSLVIPAQEFSNPVLGRYEIQRELGRGAMGVVYLGLDPKIARQVAIKTLSFREFDHDQLEHIKQRFFREAEAAGRLNHPNIVTVFDVGEESDLAYIAMDFVEGVSLDRCVSVSNLLDIDEVYDIVASVADALHYAHDQNIVHRDIKPANILYDQSNGQVKVADFGIARIVDDSKTKTGDMLGSPVYMPPEQLKGSKVTGASDIYSLGVSLYQLLTGVLPYNGDSIANLTYLILNKKYKSVREIRPELSAGVVRIVNKAMHKDPAKRYENASHMADALRGLMSREFGKKAS